MEPDSAPRQPKTFPYTGQPPSIIQEPSSTLTSATNTPKDRMQREESKSQNSSTSRPIGRNTQTHTKRDLARRENPTYHDPRMVSLSRQHTRDRPSGPHAHPGPYFTRNHGSSVAECNTRACQRAHVRENYWYIFRRILRSCVVRHAVVFLLSAMLSSVLFPRQSRDEACQSRRAAAHTRRKSTRSARRRCY